MNTKQLKGLLNTDGNALKIWCSSTNENMLTEHYNYLWEHTKQTAKNIIQKVITFQENKENENGTYNTFDVVLTEKKSKNQTIYSVIDIIQY